MLRTVANRSLRLRLLLIVVTLSACGGSIPDWVPNTPPAPRASKPASEVVFKLNEHLALPLEKSLASDPSLCTEVPYTERIRDCISQEEWAMFYRALESALRAAGASVTTDEDATDYDVLIRAGVYYHRSTEGSRRAGVPEFVDGYRPNLRNWRIRPQAHCAQGCPDGKYLERLERCSSPDQLPASASRLDVYRPEANRDHESAATTLVRNLLTCKDFKTYAHKLQEAKAKFKEQTKLAAAPSNGNTTQPPPGPDEVPVPPKNSSTEGTTVLSAPIPASAKLAHMKDEPRQALVVGNGGYATSRLRNPPNDARAVAGALRSVGFEVDLELDVNQRELKRAIDDFGRTLKPGGVSLFYFAGHGIQVNGRNYLIPVGANILSETDVDIEAVDLARVLARINAARSRINLVVLDACRNNPFARSFRSANRGLAFVNAPQGTLIAYATAPGSVAADGSGSRSPFSAAFARHIISAPLKVEEVFKSVRRTVKTSTAGNQVPWESSSLDGDFYFVLPR